MIGRELLVSCWSIQRNKISLLVAFLYLNTWGLEIFALDSVAYHGSGKSAVAGAEHTFSFVYQPAHLYWNESSLLQYVGGQFNQTGKNYSRSFSKMSSLNEQEKLEELEKLYGQELVAKFETGVYLIPTSRLGFGLLAETNVAGNIQGRVLPEVGANVWARVSAPFLFSGSLLNRQIIWGGQLFPDLVISQSLREDLIEIYENPDLFAPSKQMEQNVFIRGRFGILIPKKYLNHEFRLAAAVKDFILYGPKPDDVFDPNLSVGAQPYQVQEEIGASYGYSFWLRAPLTVYLHASSHLRKNLIIPNNYHNRYGLRLSIGHGRIVVDTSLVEKYKSMSIESEFFGLRLAYGFFREPVDLGKGVIVNRNRYMMQMSAVL